MSESEELAELLIRWEELRRLGDDTSIEQLCSDCPELASKVKCRIRAMQKMESVLGMDLATSDGSTDIADVIASKRKKSEQPLPTIPGYEIIDVLGSGGMGVVYRARQLRPERTVAVKMLNSSLIGTRQLERFFDEADAVAQLRHPNIVQIYGFGQVENVPFFSMELVDGGSLKDRLAVRSFDVAAAVRLTEVIARAIHKVHLEGFAHRDLKPANILLTTDGQPKVTDFGLVKRLDHKSGHTRTGEVLGTIGYMAPEQLDRLHGKIGPGTDVYALGTLLYEMLTGQQAFASNPALAIEQVRRDAVPRPSRIRPGVPRDVEAICLKCLEKDVTRRYETAGALADDLRRFSEHRPILARRVGTTRRTLMWMKRRPLATALMIVGVAIASAWPIMSTMSRRRVRADAVLVAPQVREILHRNCYSCHGGDPNNVQKKLHILDHDLLLDSDRRIVVPGHPNDSRLIQRIEDGSMPPEKEESRLPRLADEEFVLLERWILGGAPAFSMEEPIIPTRPVVEYSQVAMEAKNVFLEYCYKCHRFDEAEGGIKILHHRLLLHVRKVIVPHKPDESELYQLMISENNDYVMPPDTEAKQPKAADVEKIRRWIENGAPPFPKS